MAKEKSVLEDRSSPLSTCTGKLMVPGGSVRKYRLQQVMGAILILVSEEQVSENRKWKTQSRACIWQ